MFMGFKKGVKGYKICEGQEDHRERDVKFNEASMVKPTNSQHVESEKTTGYHSR